MHMYALYVPGISSYWFWLPIRSNTIWNSNKKSAYKGEGVNIFCGKIFHDLVNLSPLWELNLQQAEVHVSWTVLNRVVSSEQKQPSKVLFVDPAWNFWL